MKNKNAILIEVGVQAVGTVFSRLYWLENRDINFSLDGVVSLIEQECESQIHAILTPEDKVTQREIFISKMYAVQYYQDHLASILEHKVQQDKSIKDC